MKDNRKKYVKNEKVKIAKKEDWKNKRKKKDMNKRKWIKKERKLIEEKTEKSNNHKKNFKERKSL